jgi:hypothetical protein
MEPQLLPEGHDNPLLHLVHALLSVLPRVEAGLLGSPEKEELRPEPEVDGAAADLLAIK